MYCHEVYAVPKPPGNSTSGQSPTGVKVLPGVPGDHTVPERMLTLEVVKLGGEVQLRHLRIPPATP
jgi:hypothetical protein